MLARLRGAAELAARDPKAAVAAYDDIAASSAAGQPLKDFAALRAAMLLVDTAPFGEVSRRLEPLAAVGAPFRHSARALLALSICRHRRRSCCCKFPLGAARGCDVPPSNKNVPRLTKNACTKPVTFVQGCFQRSGQLGTRHYRLCFLLVRCKRAFLKL
jgi:hypothetical protein